MLQQSTCRKSGVTIQTCSNFAEALKHNKRTYTPHYALKELSDENESVDIEDIAQYVDGVKAAYRERMNKNMPSNTVFLREAVFVLEERHSMDDMRQLADRIERELGLKPLHISIHRDEGKSIDERNWHAHVIFGTIGQDGKTIKLGKKEMIKLQDITASSLGMKRTEPFTGKKHLGHKEYRKAMEKAAQSEKELEEEWRQKPAREPTEDEILEALKTTAAKEGNTAKEGLYEIYRAVVGNFKSADKKEPEDRLIFGLTSEQKDYIDSLRRQISILQEGIKAIGKEAVAAIDKIFAEVGESIVRVRKLEAENMELKRVDEANIEKDRAVAQKIIEIGQAVKAAEDERDEAKGKVIEAAGLIRELKTEICGIAEDLANERPIRIDNYKTLKAEYRTAKERAAEAYRKRLGREDWGGELGR